MEVFLDTVSGDLPDSIIDGISIADLETPIEDPSNITKVWAAAHSGQAKQTFQQMNKGDIVFLYHVGEGEYMGGGIVDCTLETDWFIENHWGLDYGERTLVYIFSKFNDKAMNVRDFNDALGYQPIHHPHGLQRVADSKHREELADKFGFDFV